MTEDEDESSSGDAKRMTDAMAAEATDLYELGVMGLAELSDKFGFSRQALSKRFKKDGVVKGSRAGEVKAVSTTAVLASVERYVDKRSEWVEETRLEGVKALKQANLIARKLVIDQMKKIASGTFPGSSLGDIDGDLRAAARFNKILIDNTLASLQILRADDLVEEDDLPNLFIEDLTNEEVLEHHKRTGAMPEDMTVEEMLAEEILLEGLE